MEFKNYGFLNSDILSTFIINDNECVATLWLFNYGSYSSTRRYLSSISMRDKMDIEDWICNRMIDEKIEFFPDMVSIEPSTKSECSSDMLKDYPETTIENSCLKINFTYLEFPCRGKQ